MTPPTHSRRSTNKPTKKAAPPIKKAAPPIKKAAPPIKKAAPPIKKAALPAKGRRLRRYAAFLRGVSPMNAKMPELKRAFEAAGFIDVKTVLGSGNVVFSAARAPEAALAKRAETAMQAELGHSFSTIVRSVEFLRTMVESNPFAAFRLAAGAQRVVTFLKRAPTTKLKTPLAVESARILRVDGCEAFTAYVPSPRGPVFMRLIEQTFGKDVTTRTWGTLKKVAT